MSKTKLLEQYKKEVKKFRKSAKELSLKDGKINAIFEKCFINLKNEISSNSNSNNQNAKAQIMYFIKLIIQLFTISAVFFIVSCILLTVHQPTSSIVLRNVQGLIYPGFQTVRLFSVPIITAFPWLTDLYDESCLLENPNFYVNGMECWPCKSIHSVIDLTDFIDQISEYANPFIIKTKQKEVNFTHLHHTYLMNVLILTKEATRIKSTNSSITNLKELFGYNLGTTNTSTTHISWRINKMVPARIIRKLFPKPPFISEWSGQSVERYVMIDEPAAEPYTLPEMECSYVFLIQGSGTRTIVLKPSRECRLECKTVSVVLKPSYVLWYDWWYWRPISLPTKNATDPSISYINSYC